MTERHFRHDHHGWYGEEGPSRAHRDDEPRPFKRTGPRFEGDWRSRPGRGGHWRAMAGGWQERRPRSSRGVIRAAVLALVAEQPMHGYQIIRELGERSGGTWTPSPGSIYPTLQLLSDEGLVSSVEEEGRRVYSATEAGRAVLAERGADRPAPWEEVASEVDTSVMALRRLAIQIVVATRQVAHAGTAADIAQAKTVLAEARKSLYRILAEGGEEESETLGDGPAAG